MVSSTSSSLAREPHEPTPPEEISITHCPGTKNDENLNGGNGSLAFFFVMSVGCSRIVVWGSARVGNAPRSGSPQPSAGRRPTSPSSASPRPTSALLSTMALFPTLTSHQNRVVRLSFFSFGSVLILYVLFSLTSSPSSHNSLASSAPYSASTWSPQSGLLDALPGTPYPVWGSGPGGRVASEKGGINFKEGTGEYRWSEDHPWIKARQHTRVLVASHFTAHEGQSGLPHQIV